MASLHDTDFYAWTQKQSAKLLRQNPSLRRELPAALVEAHDDALRIFDAEKLIELTMEELPGSCPFELDDRLDPDWWPQARGVQ